MAKFCERLKQALRIRNMKPSVLAYKTDISEASISHYVAGHYEPKTIKLQTMARALRVSDAWLMGLDVPMEASSFYSDENVSEGAVQVPVFGKVAAGIPLEMIQDIIDYEEIPEDMLRGGAEYFALQIQGDSMEPKISNKDVVIVRKQPDVDSNDIAIIAVNGCDATCKRVMKQADGILLVPSNPAYAPVFYSNQQIAELPITILGKVVELRAKF